MTDYTDSKTYIESLQLEEEVSLPSTSYVGNLSDAIPLGGSSNPRSVNDSIKKREAALSSQSQLMGLLVERAQNDADGKRQKALGTAVEDQRRARAALDESLPMIRSREKGHKSGRSGTGSQASMTRGSLGGGSDFAETVMAGTGKFEREWTDYEWTVESQREQVELDKRRQELEAAIAKCRTIGLTEEQLASLDGGGGSGPGRETA